MAGITITALPAVGSALLTDVRPVDQLPGPVTYKESNAQLLSLFQANGSALTEVNDTNVTLALAGSPTTALLNATSITAGWTGTLSGARGGTGVNNSGLTINLGTATTGYVLTSDSSGNATWAANPGTGGITTINGDAGSATASAGVVTINGGTTGLTTSGASHTLSLTGTLKLANGGTQAALTASNGGIFYSTASAGAILAGTATARQLLMSGTSTTPAWSTSTYPATNAANTLLYASSANTMAALATANSSGLLTNSSGVPAWVTATGTGAPVLGTSPTITTPAIVGVTDGSDAAAGDVGEFLSSFGNLSFVPITTQTATDIVSMSLTAGDWDIWMNAGIVNTAGTSIIAYTVVALTPTSGTIPAVSSAAASGISSTFATITLTSTDQMWMPTSPVRLSLATTTTIYGDLYLNYSGGTADGFGIMYARRVR